MTALASSHNTRLAALETTPLIKATGFREYDARWLIGSEINLIGVERLGLGLATLIHERGVEPRIVVGHDYRSYSLAVKQALTLGLVLGGVEVVDIGLAVSPMAYFAQFHLGVAAVAMVTASHNENGWTGVKMGIRPPLTFGPEEMSRLKTIVLEDQGVARPGGALTREHGVREAYLEDVTRGARFGRALKAVVACGNGTAGAFAPEALAAMGVEVVAMDADLDWSFPNHNPNPEDIAMLSAMAARVRETGADIGLAFDGDGDRCGVVDERGVEIFSDKIGLLLARSLSARHPDARFVVDVKSTGLYRTDPVLKANGASVLYWKTGHSYIKAKTAELGALAGFEKSGHFFFAPPIGRGYDDALIAARSILGLLDEQPGRTLTEIAADLMVAHTSPTMSPHCDDTLKYGVVDRLSEHFQAEQAAGRRILGREITEIILVNGVRVQLEDGSWLLVRASSNKPELVTVVESMRSAEDMRALFRDGVKPVLARHAEVGAFNQEV